MTEKDKTPFSEPAGPVESPFGGSTTDIDFSFFDEPMAPAPVISSAAPVEKPAVNNDLSFLDELIPTKPAVAETPAEAVDTNVFSFDEERKTDSSAMGQHDEQAAEKQDEHFHGGNAPLVPQNMSFTCPKCAAKVSVVFPEKCVPKLTEKCPACSAQVVIICESSAQRAARKNSAMYCCTCSRQLSHQIHCPACGIFCPDYYLVEDPKEAQRKVKAARSNNLKVFVANLKESLTRRQDKHDAAHQVSLAHAGKGSFLSSRKMLVTLAVAVVLLIVIAGASFWYLRQQQEQRYVTAFAKTIYVLHSGNEGMLTSMKKSQAEWKAAIESGRSYTPRPDTDMNIKLARITGEAAKLMQQLQKTPKKFEQDQARLMALQAEFNRLQSIFAVPAPNVLQFDRRLETAENAVKQKSQELKNGLAKELAAELEAARLRYRGLAGF